MAIEKTKRIVARCDASLKRKIERAEMQTGISESSLVRAAVKHFFAENQTPSKIVCAIINARSLN